MKRIDYYQRTDLALSQLLRGAAVDANSPEVTTYLHGDGLLTLRMAQLPEGQGLPGADTNQIWFWLRPRQVRQLNIPGFFLGSRLAIIVRQKGEISPQATAGILWRRFSEQNASCICFCGNRQGLMGSPCMRRRPWSLSERRGGCPCRGMRRQCRWGTSWRCPLARATCPWARGPCMPAMPATLGRATLWPASCGSAWALCRCV